MDDRLVPPQKDHGVSGRFMTQRDRRNRLQVELYLMICAAHGGNGNPSPTAENRPVHVPVEDMPNIVVAGDHFAEEMSIPDPQIV